MDISFCVCPGSSGEILGYYIYDDKQIYIDLKAIAYSYDYTLGDEFIEVMSTVLEHEYTHKILDEFIDRETAIRFDNIK